MNDKKSYIYILFNQRNGTLYVGVTNDLIRRIAEHKNSVCDGFSKKYSVDKLGYYEIFSDIENAISREKQIKGYSRAKKISLLESMNPQWNDLFDDITE